MALSIRSVTAADLPAVLGLVQALADYEKLPPPDADARARLGAELLAQPPRLEALIAELDGQVVGYAAHFMTYSTFLARPTLYLEDLFVHPDARGKGAGSALFDACAQRAVERGCGRFEWQVLAWNTPASDFYLRKGATKLADWVPFRLEGEALRRASRAPGR
jgi:GNAT superfamily N-acetyltransferase